MFTNTYIHRENRSVLQSLVLMSWHVSHNPLGVQSGKEVVVGVTGSLFWWTQYTC